MYITVKITSSIGKKIKIYYAVKENGELEEIMRVYLNK